MARRRAALVEQGIVEALGEDYVFVKDHLFSSPSMAGAVILGGNSNGRITWKTLRYKPSRKLEDQSMS